MWFWYEKNFAGKYCPVSGPQRPEKSQAGPTPERFNVVELKATDLGLTLHQLAKRYPPPEDDMPPKEPPKPEPDPTPEGGEEKVSEGVDVAG